MTSLPKNLINCQLSSHCGEGSKFENHSQNNSTIPQNRRLSPKDFAEGRKRAKQGRKGKAAKKRPKSKKVAAFQKLSADTKKVFKFFRGGYSIDVESLTSAQADEVAAYLLEVSL